MRLVCEEAKCRRAGCAQMDLARGNLRKVTEMDFMPEFERHRFFLNPYPDHRFHRCPRCGQETHTRNRVLIVQAGPSLMAPVMTVCCFCANCDLLIAHQDEMEATLREMLPPREHEAIDGPLEVIGTVDRAQLGPGGLEDVTPGELFDAFRPISELVHFDKVRDEAGNIEWVEVARPHTRTRAEVPVPETADVKALPQVKETWEVGTRQLQTWIMDEEAGAFRPFILIVVDTAGPLVVFQDMFEDEPSPEQVRDTLLKAMISPTMGSGEPRRPKVVVTDDKALAELLSFELNTLDIRCTTGPTPELDEALIELEDFLSSSQEPIRGLLDHPGVTPELVGELFEAAADFYEVAPWEWMFDEDLVAVRYPVPNGEWRFASVLGNAGMEFGLAVFEDLSDYDRLAVMPPEDAIGMMEYRSLTYDELEAMPFPDMDAVERYDWEVAAEDAYPVPLIITREGDVERPGPEEIEWYIVALRTVVDFFEEYWPENYDYVPEDVSTTFTVPLEGRQVEVEVRYPADLALEE